jgi:hypothetical protein
LKNQADHIQDLSEIRSMMERSSKFLFLSGLAGIASGLIAIAGALVVLFRLEFNPDSVYYDYTAGNPINVILYALGILVLSMGSALGFSSKKAAKAGEQIWNASTRRLLGHIAVPLLTGGIIVLIFFSQMLYGLMAPFTLIFYGMTLFIAGKFSLDELKVMGVIQIVLGIISIAVIPYSMIIWIIGFGVMHILYGIYVYLKYERNQQ